MDTLFHVSEDGTIKRFVPRPPPSPDAGVTEDVVWAVDAAHLVNYLLPRDCPRVTFYALPESDEADVAALLGPGTSHPVVAIEDVWLERAAQTALWLYTFAPEPFTVVDPGAGYYVSRQTVVPQTKRKVERPLAELVARGAELRVLPSLWPLRDRVVSSSLQFSCIRMRHAKPRPD